MSSFVASFVQCDSDSVVDRGGVVEIGTAGDDDDAGICDCGDKERADDDGRE